MSSFLILCSNIILCSHRKCKCFLTSERRFLQCNNRREKKRDKVHRPVLRPGNAETACFRGTEIIGDAESVTFTAKTALAADSKTPSVEITAFYTVTGDGKLKIKSAVKVAEKLPFLPRFGLDLVLTEGIENLNWFGFGPDDSYCDKRLSARKGLFTSTVTDSYEHPIKPQESGNHYGTEYAEITTQTHQGIAAEGNFEFSALHYPVSQLETCDLVPSPLTFLSLNYAVSGIGSNSCGPELDERHRLSTKEFMFEVELYGI